MGKHHRILALALAFAFLTSTCMILDKPVSAAATASVADSWVIKAPLQKSRGALGVVAVNDSIFAIGGSTGGGLGAEVQSGFLGTNEEYNISADNWTYRAPMPTTRDRFAIVAYENKIYCFGGHIDNGHRYDPGITWSYAISCNVTEVYDVATDKWEKKAPMLGSMMDIFATVLDGKILVQPENPSIYPGHPNYLYDPATDSWSNTASVATSPLGNKTVPSDIMDLHTFQTSGVASLRRTYAFGFFAVLPYKVFTVNEMYNPGTASWLRVANMSTSRVDFGVAVVNDVLYVVGGFVDSVRVSSPQKINEAYFPVGYGSPDPGYVLEHYPPKIQFLSQTNLTYRNSSVPLLFTVDKAVSWLGYSLDGQPTVSIDGNTSIANVTNSIHNLTLYANDTYGNYATPQIITFTVAVPADLFPILVFVAVTAVLAVVIAAVGIAVFRWRRRVSKQQTKAA